MLDLKPLRILLTGGNGFLGKSVVRVLRERGCEQISAPTSRDFDLREQTATHRMLWEYRPEVVFHLAAKCGGIGANMASPGQFIHDNLVMGLNVIEATRKHGAKIVMVGTVCSYPEHNPGLIVESDIWNGYPEPTNAPYGIAKRCLGEVLKAYHAEYDLKAAHVVLANLYGPGDSFDFMKSHVIPAIIRKVSDAMRGNAPLVCWGTGKPTRDFLFVDDAAEALVRAAERIEEPHPINVGTGRETSIADLVELISRTMGYRGPIEWDSSKPDGQPRRVLGTSRQRELLGFEPRTALADGIARTVAHWHEQLKGAA